MRAIGLRRPVRSREWTLWVVAVSCALHATEELLSGWQLWAQDSLGIATPAGPFVIGNAALVSATLANAIALHIGPTTLLFVLFSAWAYVGGWREGVDKRAMGIALAAGTVMILALVLGVRYVLP